MAQPLPIDPFFSASRRKSPPSVALRVEKRRVHHCGRSRTQGADRPKGVVRGSLCAMCEKDEENHLRCTCCAGGSFGPVLKVYQTLSGSLRPSVRRATIASPHPPPRSPPPLYSSTRYGIPDGPLHDNCPSTVFRLSSFAFGGNDLSARDRTRSSKLQTVSDHPADSRAIFTA